MSRPTEAMPAPGHEAFAIHPSLLSGLRNSSGSLAMFAAIRRAYAIPNFFEHLRRGLSGT